MEKSSQELQRQLVDLTFQIAAKLQGLTEAQLAASAPWHNTNFTVRFLLHRLAGHCADHLNQLHKVRRGIAAPPSEAQMILGQYLVAQAAVLGELVGLSEVQLAQPQAPGEWSANQVLEHLLDSQRRMLESIEVALAPKQT